MISWSIRCPDRSTRHTWVLLGRLYGSTSYMQSSPRVILVVWGSILGHVVSADGITVDPAMGEAVLIWDQPTMTTEIQLDTIGGSYMVPFFSSSSHMVDYERAVFCMDGCMWVEFSNFIGETHYRSSVECTWCPWWLCGIQWCVRYWTLLHFDAERGKVIAYTSRQ